MTGLSKKNYFNHLEELKSKSNFKQPTFIFQTSTRADKESEISTLEHYLYMNKTSEQKLKEV